MSLTLTRWKQWTTILHVSCLLGERVSVSLCQLAVGPCCKLHKLAGNMVSSGVAKPVEMGPTSKRVFNGSVVSLMFILFQKGLVWSNCVLQSHLSWYLLHISNNLNSPLHTCVQAPQRKSFSPRLNCTMCLWTTRIFWLTSPLSTPSSNWHLLICRDFSTLTALGESTFSYWNGVWE